MRVFDWLRDLRCHLFGHMLRRGYTSKGVRILYCTRCLRGIY